MQITLSFVHVAFFFLISWSPAELWPELELTYYHVTTKLWCDWLRQDLGRATQKPGLSDQMVFLSLSSFASNFRLWKTGWLARLPFTQQQQPTWQHTQSHIPYSVTLDVGTNFNWLVQSSNGIAPLINTVNNKGPGLVCWKQAIYSLCVDSQKRKCTLCHTNFSGLVICAL